MKFFVLKKKHIMLFLTILLVAIIVVVATLSFIKTSSPKRTYTVVIDAGHGGIDGGSVGVVTKNDENHLNLEYAKCLKTYFENFNIGVVLNS